jgi:Holliday junction resolvase RusA-like endonuclease
MVKVDIQPLSVNEAWQGKRFKTPKYKQYENDLLLLLPKIKLPEPPYKIYLNFGFSNKLSDWDNPIKPFVDVLQKRYGFNDRDIFEATIKKFKVEKGKEYVKFLIETVEKF